MAKCSALCGAAAVACGLLSTRNDGPVGLLRGVLWERRGPLGSATAEDIARGHSLTGKVAIITGANAGLGKETARVMAGIGAHVIMTCRSMERCEKARLEIQGTKGKLECMQMDLNSLRSVDAFAEAFKAKGLPLHFLINNAGVMVLPTYQTTQDGIEMQFGVNHLGHFRLTNKLLDTMKATEGESRVVNLSSVSHKMGPSSKSDVSAWPLGPKNYDPFLAYTLSKACGILFTLELRKRLQGTNVTAVSGHPGIVVTDLTKHNPFYDFSMSKLIPLVEWITRHKVLKTVQEGVATVMCMVLHELPDQTRPVKERLYLSDGEDTSSCPGRVNGELVFDESKAAQLWLRSEQLISSALAE